VDKKQGRGNRKNGEAVNYMDCFSGIAGFAKGAYDAGFTFDKHYFSEIEEYPCELYKLRFPNAIPIGDINKINGKELVDRNDFILTGGFPCQDVSVAGKRKGFHDEEGNRTRSGLWFEMKRLISEIQPKFVIAENVGMLVKKELAQILVDLNELGFSCEWNDIRASDIGAPHKRERIWIIAYKKINGFFFDTKIQRLGDVCNGSIVEINTLFGNELISLPKSGCMIGANVYQTNSIFEQYRSGNCENHYPSPTSSDGTTGGIIGKDDQYYETSTGMPRKINKNGKNGSVGLGRLVKLMPTPTQRDYKDSGENMNYEKAAKKGRLAGVVKMFPTPTRRSPSDCPSERNRHTPSLEAQVKMIENIQGDLNPDWVELLMAYPKGWTNKDITTDYFHFDKHPGFDCNWEDGVPRLTTDKKYRVARLKGIGNAIVPKIAELLFRRIKELL
jgi:DNA (cytosine-5)-methyltransferase 1